MSKYLVSEDVSFSLDGITVIELCEGDEIDDPGPDAMHYIKDSIEELTDTDDE